MAENKRKNRRGETLTEVLVAILVAAMAISLLSTMVISSMNINRKAREMDTGADGTGGFYGALSQVETHTFTSGDSAITVRATGGPAPTGTITFSNVRSFTDADSGLTAYGKVG